MLAVHPEIKAAQQETALAKAAAEVQRGAFMPSAQLFTAWSDTQSDSNDTVGQRYRNLSTGFTFPFRCSAAEKIWRGCVRYLLRFSRRSMNRMH